MQLSPRTTMGCTSSAHSVPKSPASHHNATANDVTDDHEDSNSIKVKESFTQYSDDESLTELPKSDTISEQKNLDRPNDVQDTYIVTVEDIPKDSQKEEQMNEESYNETDHKQNKIEVEERLSKLEEVVEKVVELYVNDNLLPHVEPEVENKEIELNGRSSPEHDTLEIGNQVEDEEVPESPTRSSSSRATRWEALADIAAELPPSMTVDPLTGQIYALK